MDGENNGKAYEQMDDLGGKPLFWETPISLRNLQRSDLLNGPPTLSIYNSLITNNLLS